MLDLRKPVDAASRSCLKIMGFEQPFGVVSAQDPMGVAQSPSVNSVLAASLQSDVAKLRVAQASLDACSPERSHCEHSMAIALDLPALIDLAYRYDQLAIFWFDGRAFWIVPVHSTKARLRLPVRP